MHQTNMTDRSTTQKVYMDYSWTKTKEDVLRQHDVEEEIGLSQERVIRDLERYGPNGKLNQYV